MYNDDPLSTQPHEKYKLWPTNADRDDFHAVMDTQDRAAVCKEIGIKCTSKRVKRRIPDAYLYFYDVVAAWVAGDPSNSDERIKALHSAIHKNIRLVVIDLGENDDAQMIFETLNARGTPLLSADLIKNSLLKEAVSEVDNVEWVYNKYWRRFDSDAAFWREEVGRGHAQRARIETFFQHSLTLLSGSIVRPSHLYTAYRDFANSPSGGSAVARLDRFRTLGEIYKRLQSNQTDPRISTFFERLDTLEVITAWPFILALFEGFEDEPEVIRCILVDLESYLVRRMVCRLSTRGYGEVFATLTSKLVWNTETGPAAVIRSFLLRRTAEVDRWPTDGEFKSAWLSYQLFKNLTRSRMRMLLEAIEAGLRSEFAETKSVPKALTIEHVMPRGWRDHWPLVNGTTAEDREQIIHTSGNLTLLNGKLNRHQSNRPWIDGVEPGAGQREALKAHSVFHLNKGLCELDDWGEDRITERSIELFAVARRIWPRRT